VYVDQALLPELVAQRSQPPLTPYRRRTTIWRQSGGGPCTFAGHPPPSGRWHDSEGPPARRATTWRVLTGRLVAVSWDRPGRSGQQHASGPVSRMSRVDLRVSPGVARRAAAGAPKARGRHWFRASGAAGAALIKYGATRQRLNLVASDLHPAARCRLTAGPVRTLQQSIEVAFGRCGCRTSLRHVSPARRTPERRSVVNGGLAGDHPQARAATPLARIATGPWEMSRNHGHG
jgi:hypothetical protein